MPSAQNHSWQERYQAGRARDEERNIAGAQMLFGGPVGLFLLKGLPLLALVFFAGFLTLGVRAGLINVALLLCVQLGFRAWARRRYRLNGTSDLPGSSDSA